MPLFEALWKFNLMKIFMICTSVHQIQDLHPSKYKCGFSKKAFRRQYFFFLFNYVLLIHYHHLRAKLGMYIALSIFLNFWQVWWGYSLFKWYEAFKNKFWFQPDSLSTDKVNNYCSIGETHTLSLHNLFIPKFSSTHSHCILFLSA